MTDYKMLSVSKLSDLLISSKQNNLVKYIRSLREKRNREKEGYYVVEGAKSVLEAVSAGLCPSRFMLSERGEKHSLTKEILTRLGDSVHVTRVSDEVMDYMGETDTPQGLIATFPLPKHSLSELDFCQSTLLVVVDGVQDPGNVGTIVRTADAFGVQAVILTKGCADIFNSKTLRSSMGSVFHIPVIRDVDTPDLIAHLKNNSVFTAVTTLAENSLPLAEVNFPRPGALVFGSEGKGVSPEIVSNADVLLKIPIIGSAESLNVAIASGIVLYEATLRHGSGSNETCK